MEHQMLILHGTYHYLVDTEGFSIPLLRLQAMQCGWLLSFYSINDFNIDIHVNKR